MRHILQIFFVLLSVVGFGQFTELVGWQEIDQDCNGGSAPNELFISEVYDSWDQDYGIVELYNPTNFPIVLTGNYRIYRYGNIGDPSPSYDVALTGTIPANSAFLVRFGTLTGTVCNNISPWYSGESGFNGNDEFELIKNGFLIDNVHTPNSSRPNGGGYSVSRKPESAAPKSNYDSQDWITEFRNQGDYSNCATLGNHSIPKAPDLISIEQQTTSLCYVPTDPQLPRIRFTFQVNNPPYEYSLNGSPFVAFPGVRFLQLAPGNYTIIFKDANDCTVTATFTVRGGIQTSPIILLNP